MSKISRYLNEHLLGEVTTSTAVRKQFSHDASMIGFTPEIVAHPKVTNDIRKILRFTHQLAEKGHPISITARGAGTDVTGAATGSGIVINTVAHMNEVIEYDPKKRLVHVQPGVNFGSLQTALKLQGCFIPSFPDSVEYSTIGGAVANNASGRYSGQRGAIEESVEQLEVVLANGDVLQTSRLSKKELNQKKGLQTLEGEIYRTIDNLIEDNRELIEQSISSDTIDNSGYPPIRKVKEKNGSFDLAPLFVGSQGTLGVISEMILKVDFYNNNEILLAIVVRDKNSLVDLLDDLKSINPETLEVFAGGLLERAHKNGKQYGGILSEDAGIDTSAGLILCSFQDFNERVRKRKLKKALKAVSKFGGAFEVADKRDRVRELAALRGIPYSALHTEEKAGVVSPLFRGVYIPSDRFEDFCGALAKLEKSLRLELPYSGFASDGVYSFWPQMSLQTAADKQKLLKLYDAFAALVYEYKGSVVAESGEGRIKTPFIAKQMDEDVANLYQNIRKIFDEHGTLNTGVKQPNELRQVVARLRTGYDGADFSHHTAAN